MAYATLNDLLAKLPLQHLTDALDDDGDGAVDDAVVTLVLDQASREVDSYLEARYDTPLVAADFTNDTLPGIVTSAAIYFALRSVFTRRGLSLEQFPFNAELKNAVQTLEKIRDGKLALVAGLATVSNTGAVIEEDSSLNGSLV